jgi:hypothetical protein
MPTRESWRFGGVLDLIFVCLAMQRPAVFSQFPGDTWHPNSCRATGEREYSWECVSVEPCQAPLSLQTI